MGSDFEKTHISRDSKDGKKLEKMVDSMLWVINGSKRPLAWSACVHVIIRVAKTLGMSIEYVFECIKDGWNGMEVAEQHECLSCDSEQSSGNIKVREEDNDKKWN